MKMGMKWTIPILASILILGSVGLSQQAFAIPTSVIFDDIPSNCDPFFIGPDSGDELGNSPLFPPDELIVAFDFGTDLPACSVPGGGNGFAVQIENLSGLPWHDVIYVANSDTFISNFDGTVDGFAAFLIDAPYCDPSGVNHPLVSESLTLDCIFEPGEFWIFLIDDYDNFDSNGPLPREKLGSPGIGSFLPPFDTSSGSIFAFADFGVGGTALPIDTTALLVAGAQTISPWLILGVISAVGIGLAVFTLKRR